MRSWCAIVVLVAGLLTARTVRAQWETDAQFDRIVIIPVETREVARIAPMLNLDDDQTLAARMLFEGFVAAYETRRVAILAHRARVREASRRKGDGWENVLKNWDEALTRFMIQRRDTEIALFKDIKTLLKPDQVDRWPAIERLRRRVHLDRVISNGPSRWCKIDLYRLIDRCDLTGSQAAGVSPVLAEYDLALDRPLSLWHEARNIINSQSVEERPDEDRTRRASRDLDAASGEIGRINHHFWERAGVLLEQSMRQKLEAVTHPLVYPELLEIRRPAGDLLPRVTALDDLSDDQRTRLAEVQASYERDSAAMLRRHMREFDELTTTLDSMNQDERIKAYREFPNDQIWRRAENEREAFETATRERLMAILTPPQRLRFDPPRKP